MIEHALANVEKTTATPDTDWFGSVMVQVHARPVPLPVPSRLCSTTGTHPTTGCALAASHVDMGLV